MINMTINIPEEELEFVILELNPIIMYIYSKRLFIMVVS